MRKIKFRGHTGACWVYGNLIQYKDSAGNDHAQIEETDWDDFGCWDVAPESAGQWTGLVDKAGKDVYEGDVLESTMGRKRKMVFYQGEYQTAFKLMSETGRLTDKGLCDVKFNTVIGNVFEHPELVK